MSAFALQQTTETLRQNLADWDALHQISNEQAEKQMAEYKREKRLKYIRRYLKERAARAGR